MTRYLALTFVAALVTLTGCGRGPVVYTVRGTVTFDGAPVQDGDIAFKPEDGKLRTEGGKIVNGEYTLKVHPGKNKISITAAKVNPALKSPAGEPVREDYIPEQYNFATTLQEDVAANDNNRFNFALTSKPGKK